MRRIEGKETNVYEAAGKKEGIGEEEDSGLKNETQ